MKYKAVLFDMNGVIVDDEPLHLASFRSVLRGKGYALTDEGYKQYFAGKTDKDGFESYLYSIDQTYDLRQLMSDKSDAYIKLAHGTLRPYEGIIEFIEALYERGLPLALVTSSLPSEAETVLQTFGIKDCFRVVITADDIQNGKPEPEGYLKGAKELGAVPADCLVIEDAPCGVMAAKSAGMACIAITNTHAASDLAGADEIVGKLDQASIAQL